MTTLYIKNLSYKAEEADLEYLLDDYSPSHVSIIRDRQTNDSRGFAFVEFMDSKDADKVIDELNDTFFMGRRLMIEVSTTKKLNKSTL